LTRKRYVDPINDIKELLRIKKMKDELDKIRAQNKNRKNAVRIIENFWNTILDKRDNEKLEEHLKTMPKDCRELYRKFINLRKQTKNLKQNLTNLNN
jgi:hypothetical protein